MLIDWQTVCAVAIVFLAVASLVRRQFLPANSRPVGCGSCHRCPQRAGDVDVYQLN